jgi:hypothetical protein
VNTGQTILTIGAMVLLSTIMLRVNTTNLTNESVRDQAQYGVLATSIATSIIEEAQSKAFDAKTDSNSVTTKTDLTSYLELGPDDGETSESLFNDFDDYDGFTKCDSTMPSAIFDIACEVVYVASNNVQGFSSTQTWHKKLNITVTSPFSPDTFRTSSIFSYWFFR